MKRLILILLIIIFTPYQAISNNAVLWNKLSDHIQTIDIDEHPNTTDCPSELSGLKGAVVLQWIENTFYKWQEYDTGDGVCIVMLQPENRALTSSEATVLLKASSLWRQPLKKTYNARTIDASTLPIQGLDNKKTEDTPDETVTLVSEEISSPITPTPSLNQPHKVVIGWDDRVEVGNTEVYPYNTICYLDFYQNGSPYRGTGFLISPYAVLTNAHNLYDYDTGEWSEYIAVAPGQYEGWYYIHQPYGEKSSYQTSISDLYADTGDFKYDVGVAKLETPFTGISTFMPLRFSADLDSSYTLLNLSGYHGTVKGVERYGQWRDSGYTSLSWTTSSEVYYAIDATSGASGSPVWLYYPSTSARYVVALNAFSSDYVNLNGGPRLTQYNQDMIEGWAAWTPGPDTSGAESFVTRFYQECLQRQPEPAGKDNWVNHLVNRTMTGEDLAFAFIFSPEFMNKNWSDGVFVSILYKAFFNRFPDDGGYQNWMNHLSAGKTRTDILYGFTKSVEFQNLCAQYGISPY